MAQQLTIPLGSMRTWVQSLALLSGLKIWCWIGPLAWELPLKKWSPFFEAFFLKTILKVLDLTDKLKRYYREFPLPSPSGSFIINVLTLIGYICYN